MSERTHRVDEIEPDYSPEMPGIRIASGGGLFAWRDGEVVLLAERADQSYVLARGWAYDDRLVHVRRWRFPTPAALAGQVRRLAREATGNQGVAATAATAALAWAHEQAPADPGATTD